MTIIPAAPGFRLVKTHCDRTLKGMGDDLVAASEIVIAFAIDPSGPIGGDTAPIPITATGAPMSDFPWLLIHPDGVLSMGGYATYDSFAAWKEDVRWEQ